jgi:hypothetical protein
MNNLREFLYLDSTKLQSFISQIHGGFINEITETTKQLGGISAGVNIGVLPVGGKIDASKGKESESKRTIQLTDPAYFDILYRFLRQEKILIEITESSKTDIDSLKVGDFIEVEGFAQPPVVENWIIKVKEIFTFFTKNISLLGANQSSKSKMISKQQMSQLKQILDFLVDFINISRKDPGRQYIRIALEYLDCNVWCGLLPEFIYSQLNALLPSKVRILGRIERKLKPDEVWKVVDLDQFSQSNQANQLLEMLNGLNAITGREISEEELQAQSPDFFVSPLAIYQ